GARERNDRPRRPRKVDCHREAGGRRSLARPTSGGPSAPGPGRRGGAGARRRLVGPAPREPATRRRLARRDRPDAANGRGSAAGPATAPGRILDQPPTRLLPHALRAAAGGRRGWLLPGGAGGAS